jgi:glycerol-3-phosphate acyltransferase PlsX
MRIAIDAMGGDFAPQACVEGAERAAREWKDVEIVLVGREEQIRSCLRQNLPNVTIRHADDVITPDDEPARAVRRKKNASMVVAGRMVREREADAMISAGNTGALMVTGLLVIGRIPGIERPALAPMLPTMNGQGVLALDMGANMDASPDNLLQYAIMGSIYREKVLGIDKPRVGLLNVGTEAQKGNELTKAAFPLLEQAPVHFMGNVEARDVLNAKCDVIVCDGFAGNILLKAMEGTAEAIISVLKEEFTKTFLSKLAAAVLKPRMKSLVKKLDYSEHGGAPFLGVDGLVLKSHGSSDANAIKNAVRQARIAIRNGLIQAISTEIGRGSEREI